MYSSWRAVWWETITYGSEGRVSNPLTPTYNPSEFQFVQEHYNVSNFDIYLGVDGISIYFILLTTGIMPIALISTWNSISQNRISLLVLLLITEVLLLAVFLALDVLLFYIFFESILIPLFLLIGLFGSSNKVKASFYLFLYTLAGSLFLLLAILTINSIMGVVWWWFGTSLLCLQLSNSGNALKLLVPNYIRNNICELINYLFMVTIQKIQEIGIGNRGSKSIVSLKKDTIVIEQRVEGSWQKKNAMHLFALLRCFSCLRCILTDFARNYQTKIPS